LVFFGFGDRHRGPPPRVLSPRWCHVSIFVLTAEVEGEEPLVSPGRRLENFGTAECAHGVVIAGLPVFLHGATRELVVLGIALVALWPVDQLHDVDGVTFHDRA